MLISAHGHIKLADFGLSALDDSPDEDEATAVPQSAPNEMGDAAKQMAAAAAAKEAGKGAAGEEESAGGPARPPSHAVGTPDYLAPEILLREGYSNAVDFWALGVVLYQFLVGETPFCGESPQEVFRRILGRDCEIHEMLAEASDEQSGHAADIINRLLTLNAAERLGTGGVANVKQHAFFDAIDWSEELWKMESPHKPNIMHSLDTSSFMINERQRVAADRMRNQLEDDHSDTHEELPTSLTPRGNVCVPISVGRSSGVGISDNESDSDARQDDMSFRTLNAMLLARMQLTGKRDGDASPASDCSPAASSRASFE